MAESVAARRIHRSDSGHMQDRHERIIFRDEGDQLPHGPDATRHGTPSPRRIDDFLGKLPRNVNPLLHTVTPTAAFRTRHPETDMGQQRNQSSNQNQKGQQQEGRDQQQQQQQEQQQRNQNQQGWQDQDEEE
jgi:hypothetical protein